MLFLFLFIHVADNVFLNSFFFFFELAFFFGVFVCVAASEFPLPQSSAGVLLVASSLNETRDDGSFRVVARSYDGHPWEMVPDVDFLPANLTCNASGICNLFSNNTYTVQQLPVPAELLNPSPLSLVSRLQIQATFGASKAELQRISTTYGTNFGDWVRDQMRIPPTFVRSYYRERITPRSPRNPVQIVMAPNTKVCDLDTRWHRFAFEMRDRGKNLVVRIDEVANRFTLRVDRELRGEVTNFLGQPFPGVNITLVSFPATMRICTLREAVGGAMTLTRNTSSATCDVNWSNPAISISSTTYVQSFTNSEALIVPVAGAPDAVVLKSRSVPCANATDPAGNSFISQGGRTWRFDVRMQFVTNTIDSPSTVGTSSADTCPIITKSYINRGNCIRRASCGAAIQFRSAPVPLNETILRAWYEKNNRYVYNILGLRLDTPYDVSPCSSGFSRWTRTTGTCSAPTTSLDDTTRTTISAALSGSSDTNPFVRDISLSGVGCTASAESIGAQIQVGGECFQHVHPDLYSVRDATRWTQIHDGNQEAISGGAPNPIMKWADTGKTFLRFSTSHPMQRWADRQSNLPFVGRLGDSVDFESLSAELQTEEMAVLVGALRNLPAGAEGAEACGSPAEVANRPELGNHYMVYVGDNSSLTGDTLDWPVNFLDDFPMVANNAHLKSPDQLRQRAAWTLANIIVAGEDLYNSPEAWLSFYDIFVKNAFGNYFDILKHVSYHPIMGNYLSFMGNRAYFVGRTYPDENYAREVMQLFSIGLNKLGDDGEPKRGDDGVILNTYTNDDILDYARIWTGFDRRPFRKNILDSLYSSSGSNFIDPMVIRPSLRDRFPKAKLDDGYIGDTYPLCDELPARPFLLQGAQFEYTGDVSAEGDTLDREVRRGRLTPVAGSSSLYAALCAPRASDGTCTFPLRVKLPSTLPCSGAQECGAGRVRTVRIVDPLGNATKYYSFIPPPCVRLTFFDNGQFVRRPTTRSQCANPLTAVAAPICCNASDVTRAVTNYTSECLFSNEVTDYATAQQRCAAMGLTTCSNSLRTPATFLSTCADDTYVWTTTPCQTRVQVYLDGRIGIVDATSQFFILSKTSKNVFRVRWSGGSYPAAPSGVCPTSCVLEASAEGNTCMCNYTVSASAPFSQASDIPSDQAVETIAGRCPIGASNPTLFSNNGYRQCTSAACSSLQNVKVWLFQGEPDNTFTTNTLFEVPPFRRGGRVRYLLNRVSTVNIGSFSFRNPPVFSPLLGQLYDVAKDYFSDNLWIPQAEYEVDALLEHLFEHDNTAPFLAYRFIQQMVTSNPSPRYVSAVVNAFRTGAVGTETFSGRYGDLAATFYAVLTDREARSPILEADPRFGMMRDPLLKLYHLMRSLEYKTNKGREVNFLDLPTRFGVQPFRSPSVFGFYLPEFQPAGKVSNEGLVAPQAQLATTPNIVGFLNGATSLVDIGLSSCDGGFGTYYGRSSCGDVNNRFDGNLTYTPPPGATPQQIVDDLDIVLTSGRLNSTTRAYMVSEYLSTLNRTKSADLALKQVMKLFVMSAEFHTSAANLVSNKPRTDDTSIKSKNRRMKAIVVIFESGGCDSFSRIVPLANCGAKDLFAEYQTVRSSAALNTTDLLPINVPAGTQPCDTFGVHSSFSRLRSMYNAGEALFLANVGSLVESVTLDDLRTNRKRVPPSLYAHNSMQRNGQNMHPQLLSASGVLGRIIENLQTGPEPYKSALFSLSGRVKMVQGRVPPNFITSSTGVVRLRTLSTLKPIIGNLTQQKSDSIFAETYSDAMAQALDKSEYLGQLLSNSTLNTTFAATGINTQLAQVARLMKSLARYTDTERVAFFTDRGSFDTHFTFDLKPMFSDIDSALGSFSTEMKQAGLWDDIVVISLSDFGRTLTSNGQGTDHAWGGNHFVAGGKINGGRILGKYPGTLTDDGPFSLGRGRILPSIPYESAFQGIAEWFGITPAQMATVLPNAANFPADQLFTQSELFKP
jgi:uncharacterized protein (DUF1501 family)/uncharacterized protein (DUF1800 family)